jgi:hypothetical protein
MEINMSYTYYLHHIPTDQHYYGARWAKNCSPSDFWVSYFTSSDKVKRLIDEYGTQSFTFSIRKVFVTSENARRWEHRVLKKIKKYSHKKWLNITNGQPPICNYSRVGQGLGRRLSDSHKESISKGNIGISRPQTSDHVRKAAATRIGKKRSNSTKNKMSIASRSKKNIYTFENKDIVYTGNQSDWADLYDLNVSSAATTFCNGRSYKGWTRTSISSC